MKKAKLVVSVARAIKTIAYVMLSISVILLETTTNQTEKSLVVLAVVASGSFITILLTGLTISMKQNYIVRQEAANERDEQKKSCRAFYNCQASKRSGFNTWVS